VIREDINHRIKQPIGPSENPMMTNKKLKWCVVVLYDKRALQGTDKELARRTRGRQRKKWEDITKECLEWTGFTFGFPRWQLKNNKIWQELSRRQ